MGRFFYALVIVMVFGPPSQGVAFKFKQDSELCNELYHWNKTNQLFEPFRASESSSATGKTAPAQEALTEGERRKLNVYECNRLFASTLARSDRDGKLDKVDPKQLIADENSIGFALSIVREVHGNVAGKSKKLVPRDDVYFEQILKTGDYSAAKLVFADESKLSIGDNSNVRLDKFIYNSESTDFGNVVAVNKGIIRFVSSFAAKKKYQFKTPVATIGIRGTNILIIVEDDGATEVIVEEGQVAVTSDETISIIDAGKKVLVTKESGLTSPTPIGRLPDAATRMEQNLAEEESDTDNDPFTVTPLMAAIAGLILSLIIFVLFRLFR